MDPEQLFSSLMVSAGAVNHYISTSTKNKLALDNVINRIKINCSFIHHSIEDSTESCQILINFFAAIQDLEYYLFSMGSKVIDIQKSSDLLDICNQQLLDLFKNILLNVERDSRTTDPMAPDFHPIILLNCDLNIIKALFIRDGQEFPCSQPILPQLLGGHHQDDIEAEEMIRSIHQRQQNLLARTQLAVTPSSFSPPSDSEFSVTLREQHFVILSKKMDNISKSYLAHLFVLNDQLCATLKGFQDQVKEIRMGLVRLEPLTLGRLDILLTDLNTRLNHFIELKAIIPEPSLMAEHHLDHEYEAVTPLGVSKTNNQQFKPGPSKIYGNIGDPSAYNSDDDFEALLDSIENATETVNYVQPSDEMLRALKECCLREHVKDVCWSLSTSTENGIVVNGKGISDEDKIRLEAE